MDRDHVLHWVDDYESAWRSPGTESVRALFTDSASYRMSPWRAAVTGLPAIEELWEAERTGPGEDFALAVELVAVDGDVAVVRVEVDYRTTGSRWRDLWVLHFAPDGRCAAFEEWPFSPAQSDGH